MSLYFKIHVLKLQSRFSDKYLNSRAEKLHSVLQYEYSLRFPFTAFWSPNPERIEECVSCFGVTSGWPWQISRSVFIRLWSSGYAWSANRITADEVNIPLLDLLLFFNDSLFSLFSLWCLINCVNYCSPSRLSCPSPPSARLKPRRWRSRQRKKPRLTTQRHHREACCPHPSAYTHSTHSLQALLPLFGLHTNTYTLYISSTETVSLFAGFQRKVQVWFLAVCGLL